MSTIKVDTLQARDGSSFYPSKAWVNFDGSAATLSSRADGNISSLTDNGTGNYTASFTTFFADANYAVGTAASRDAGQSTLRTIGVDEDSPPATGAASVNSQVDTTNLDSPRVMLSFTR